MMRLRFPCSLLLFSSCLLFLGACGEPPSAEPLAEGGLQEICYPNNTCDAPYFCNEEGRCIEEESGDGDGTPGDGDGTPGDGDGTPGDGDGTPGDGDGTPGDGDGTPGDGDGTPGDGDGTPGDGDGTPGDGDGTPGDGDGTPGDGDGTCVPLTCEDLGAQCGTPDDGCGETLYCDSCPSYTTNARYDTCNSGTCEYQCLPGTTLTADGCRDFQRIAAGLSHSCAIDGDGNAFCWGSNSYGQLGDGTTDSSLTPVAVQGLSGVHLVAIEAGNHHSCALDEDGDVYCWGRNDYGQLGDGTDSDRTLPTAVTGLSEPVLILSLDAVSHHACVVTASKVAYCWGKNDQGQLGDGTTAHRATPTLVGTTSNENVITISVGRTHSCFSRAATFTTTHCFGENGFGQLGDHTTITRYLPRATFHSVTSLRIAGGGFHTCVIGGNGRLRCWGRNIYGQLGNPSGSSYTFPPLSESTIPGGAVEVRAGTFHTCALMDNGGLKCWGSNSSGQVTGLSSSYATPRDVTDHLFGVQFFDTGWYHTCSIKTDQVIRCWGINGSGQLGDGTTDSSSTPVEVTLPL